MNGRRAERFASLAAAILLSACRPAVPNSPSSPAPPCTSAVRTLTVRGGSMQPMVDSGAMVRAAFGYYDCHEPVRGDVALLLRSPRLPLMIKRIMAVPGDRVELRGELGVQRLYVNGRRLENSQRQPYVVRAQERSMVALYLTDYDVVPAAAYLLLGDVTHGSMDGRSFGFVSRQDLVAKVELDTRSLLSR